jgi:hypothetical protein
MSDDFSQVKVNGSGPTFTVSGKAKRASTASISPGQVTVAEVDNPANTATYNTPAFLLPITVDVPVVIVSGSDPGNHTWTVSADGQSITVS